MSFVSLPDELIEIIIKFTTNQNKNIFTLCVINQIFNKNTKPEERFIHIEPDSYPKLTNNKIKELINLTSLNLANNRVIKDDGINSLTNLTSLNLKNNFSITNNGINNLINLKSLNLDHNNFITNNGIKGLTNLTFLCIIRNMNITNDSIKHLSLLK